MKKFSFLALVAAGMLLGACSDKDDAKDVAVNPSGEFKDGAYIGLSLSLPSADNTTRANDDLNNGTAEEFAVKNATLYIFKLAKSSTDNPDVAATYVDKVSLGNTYEADQEGPNDPDEWKEQEDVDVTNITSTYNKATLIPNELASEMKSDTDNNYYAYVVINHNGQVGVEADMTFENFSKQEFTEIGADIAAEQYIYETGLLMTNAPISSKAGGSDAPATGAKYTTLVELDNTKIFGGKTEAESNPAACVYVERAAVKITVEDGRTETKIGDMEVTLLGWQVINNERSYYNTRQIEEAWGPYTSDQKAAANNKYRFVSLYQFLPQLPTSTDHTTAFRTYFAKGVNYDTDAQPAVLAVDGSVATESTLDNTVASDDRPWIAVGAQKHAYTTENTFDVGRQTWRNTTMVTLKAQIGDGTTGFYTVGKGSQTILPTADDAKAAIVNFIKGDNDVAAALTALRTIISKNNTNQEVTSGLKVEFTAPTEGTTDVPFTVDAAFKLENQDYTNFNNTVQDANGKTEKDYYDELIAAVNAVIKTTTGTGSAAVTTTAENVLLSYYAGGVSYYNVRIQHFGEPETPWSAGGDYITGGGKDVKEIYGYDTTKGATDGDNVLASQRFLGRYGVVRDNWYKLSIDKIGKIGTAEPVDPSTTTPDTPDDEIENYISVHVHIVPWVLRSQSVEF